MPKGWANKGHGRWRRGARLLATLVFTWHLAALTLPQLTRQSLLGEYAQRWFSRYNQWVGAWGTWEMFTTIPYYVTFDVSLVAQDAAGQSQNFGVLLPGLRSDELGLRSMLFFMRATWEQDLSARYLKAYVAKACQALRAEKHFPALSISLQVKGARLRKLSDIAQDGFIGEANDFQKGPLPCTSAS